EGRGERQRRGQRRRFLPGTQIADVGDPEARVTEVERRETDTLDGGHEARGADRALGLWLPHRLGNEGGQGNAEVEQAAARHRFGQRHLLVERHRVDDRGGAVVRRFFLFPGHSVRLSGRRRRGNNRGNRQNGGGHG